MSLPATAVTCAPGRIDRLDPDASREILVTVAVGEDARPGAYHGQLLVDGLPDVVFPLRVRVLPNDERLVTTVRGTDGRSGALRRHRHR